MTNYLGDFTTSNTIYVPFQTFTSDDPAASIIVSDFVVGDIAIYKNGSITQRTSTAGFTLLDTDGIDFDAVTGIHGFSIDLSDNTDAGFYVAGGEYWIIVGPVTVDAATINFIAATFSIERTGGALALLKGTNSLANIEDKIDIIDTNVDDIETAVITNAAGADIAADIIVIEGQTDDIGVAGAGLTDLGGMSTGMKAEINTEADDVINVDTIAEEAQGIPPATPTLKQAISWWWMTFRNASTVTSSQRNIVNDAGVVQAKASMTDDGTTFDPGELVSGP